MHSIRSTRAHAEKNAKPTSRNNEEVTARRGKRAVFFCTTCALITNLSGDRALIRRHLYGEKSRARRQYRPERGISIYQHVLPSHELFKTRMHAPCSALVCPNRSSITQERCIDFLENRQSLLLFTFLSSCFTCLLCLIKIIFQNKFFNVLHTAVKRFFSFVQDIVLKFSTIINTLLCYK